MSRSLFLPACLSAICCVASASASDLPVSAASALSGDPAAVQTLRHAGPPGLEALLSAAAPRITELSLNKVRLDAESAVTLRAAVDGVAGQRDAWASGLYWFTDLDAAKAEAVKTKRPILSLRLLGNLDEEYCCANSRFFRTVLYANEAVSKVLRERYVLHWKSVRPAPLLTIDMGDGRRIKRTITGNSIHYILDAEGKVRDALPGIYSPAAFLQALDRSREKVTGKSMAEWREWHGMAANSLCMEWLAASVRAGVYDEKMRTSLKDPEQSDRIWRALVQEAFPASSGGIGAGADVVSEQSLPTAQSTRFNQGFEMGISQGPVDIAELFSSDRENPAAVVRIREFPLPTDFDPPKGMVERPILKQTVPDQPTNEPAFPVTPTEPVPYFPYSTAHNEFDPPQIPKGMVEGPVMKRALPGNANEALDPASPAQPGPSLAGRMTQSAWAAIAAPCRPWVRLDESSRRFMMQKLPEGIATEAETKTGQPESPATPFGRLLGRFEDAIARDMVRNEYYYHTLIHQWLEEDKDGSLTGDVEALNRRVYQELFLTPDYDAWLGLVPEDTYTAIEKDGCACDKGAPPMRQSKR